MNRSVPIFLLLCFIAFGQPLGAKLQASTRTIKSHVAARIFVESLILQFQKLTVTYSEFSRGLQYAMDLDFDDLEQKSKRDDAENRHRLAEGDAQGRNSTEKHMKYLEATRKRLIVLEQNALKRGDKLLPRR